MKNGLAAGTSTQLNAARLAINGALATFTGAALTAIRDAIRSSLEVEISDNLMPNHLRGVVPVQVAIA